jgi:CRISPR/Cas system endoribonuclease Cas6 (RAMP superfamily)
MIISSPDDEFIFYLHELLQLPLNRSEVKIGCMKFRIDYVDKLVQKIPYNVPVALITGTPIIVRIPKEKYKEYGIEPKKEYDKRLSYLLQ